MRRHTRWIAVLGLAVLGACGEDVTGPQGPARRAVGCGEGCPVKKSVAPDPQTVPDPATITGH